jgi:hypothetical protein
VSSDVKRCLEQAMEEQVINPLRKLKILSNILYHWQWYMLIINYWKLKYENVDIKFVHGLLSVIIESSRLTFTATSNR